MQLFSPRPFRRLTLGRAAAVLALVCGSAACDRHSAAELPESYGHGSSHQKSYTDHKADSRRDSNSFSDSQGIEVDEKGVPPAERQPSATPAATAPGRFFPSGS